MDVPELLRRATELVPLRARSDAGLCADEVRDYLRQDEWEVALGILEDFDGVQWQTVEFWDLLAGAAQQMSLSRRCGLVPVAPGRDRPRHHEGRPASRRPRRWRSPHAGPWTGRLRPMWAIGHPSAEKGADLHVARIWVESAPEISPGGRGSIRLAPLTPANWRHLAPGDVVTMHERQSVSGTATITQIQRPLLLADQDRALAVDRRSMSRSSSGVKAGRRLCSMAWQFGQTGRRSSSGSTAYPGRRWTVPSGGGRG